MSISSELRASARATYRTLFRSAASTFKGDDRVLNAFREKVRNDYRAGRSITDPNSYAARIKLGQEVAEVLRKNIVQAVKVDNAEDGTHTVQDDQGIWKLRFNEHTELGSNDTIKSNPSPCSSSRPKREPRASQAATSSSNLSEEGNIASLDNAGIIPQGSESIAEDEEDPSFQPEQSESESINAQRKLNYSALKRAHQSRERPVIDESDIEESFVRGSGPGGQSINKTQNNVQLLHKPTGIRISCQETRSLEQNRVIARKILLDKLDQIANPGLSKENMKRAKQIERERRRRKKARKKACGTNSANEDE